MHIMIKKLIYWQKLIGLNDLKNTLYGPRPDKICHSGFLQARFKPVSSATVTTLKIEILPVSS